MVVAHTLLNSNQPINILCGHGSKCASDHNPILFLSVPRFLAFHGLQTPRRVLRSLIGPGVPPRERGYSWVSDFSSVQQTAIESSNKHHD